MKKSKWASICFAVTMMILFSIVFVNILGGAGIGVGLALGTGFYVPATKMFKSLDDKKKK